MWIFLSDAYLSIVRDRDGDGLLVRARAEGDIERVFPGATVDVTPAADYRYRARVSRERVGQALTDAAMSMQYDNFKNSVRDQERHDVYMGVWSVMHSWQARSPRPGMGALYPLAGEPVLPGLHLPGVPHRAPRARPATAAEPLCATWLCECGETNLLSADWCRSCGRRYDPFR